MKNNNKKFNMYNDSNIDFDEKFVEMKLFSFTYSA